MHLVDVLCDVFRPMDVPPIEEATIPFLIHLSSLAVKHALSRPGTSCKHLIAALPNAPLSIYSPFKLDRLHRLRFQLISGIDPQFSSLACTPSLSTSDMLRHRASIPLEIILDSQLLSRLIAHDHVTPTRLGMTMDLLNEIRLILVGIPASSRAVSKSDTMIESLVSSLLPSQSSERTSHNQILSPRRSDQSKTAVSVKVLQTESPGSCEKIYASREPSKRYVIEPHSSENVLMRPAVLKKTLDVSDPLGCINVDPVTLPPSPPLTPLIDSHLPLGRGNKRPRSRSSSSSFGPDSPVKSDSQDTSSRSSASAPAVVSAKLPAISATEEILDRPTQFTYLPTTREVEESLTSSLRRMSANLKDNPESSWSIDVGQNSATREDFRKLSFLPDHFAERSGELLFWSAQVDAHSRMTPDAVYGELGGCLTGGKTTLERIVAVGEWSRPRETQSVNSKFHSYALLSLMCRS
jgi:hypothetical protein